MPCCFRLGPFLGLPGGRPLAAVQAVCMLGYAAVIVESARNTYELPPPPRATAARRRRDSNLCVRAIGVKQQRARILTYVRTYFA